MDSVEGGSAVDIVREIVADELVQSVAAVILAVVLLASFFALLWRLRNRDIRCSCHHEFGKPVRDRFVNGLVYECALCHATIKRVDNVWPPSCSTWPDRACGWPYRQPLGGLRGIRFRALEVLRRGLWSFSDAPE